MTCVYEGKGTSTTISNLKPYKTYVFRVRAISGSDEGPYSGGALVSTLQGGMLEFKIKVYVTVVDHFCEKYIYILLYNTNETKILPYTVFHVTTRE